MNAVKEKTLTKLQQERRSRILQATREELARLGYDRLNMRDLAVASQVSTATLYNLYQSKDTLILVALQDQLNNIALNASGDRGFERLVGRIESSARQIMDTPTYAEAMSRMLFNADAQDPVVRTVMTVAMRQDVISLKEMVEDGDLQPEADLELIARDLTSTAWGTILLWLKGYVALHDFAKEYVGSQVRRLVPFATPQAEAKVRRAARI